MTSELEVPGHDSGAERAVVGALLLGGVSALSICREVGLRGEHFYDPRHELMFEVSCRVADRGEPLDAHTLVADLSSEELRKVGGMAVVGDTLAAAGLPDAVGWHARTIVSTALLRRLWASGQRISRLAQTAPSARADEALERARADLDSVVQTHDVGAVTPLSEVIPDAVERMEDQRPRGVPTGLKDLDELLGGGMSAGQFLVIGARPSVGKTMLGGVVLAAAIARQGVPTYVASLEMTRLDMADRYMAHEAGVDLRDIRAGRVKNDQWERMAAAEARIAQWPLLIDDSSDLTVADLRGRLREATRKRQMGFIVVDYLQLVKPRDVRISREQQVSEISRGMKALSKDYRCPVLALAQLSRQTETRRGTRPQLSDLRESGSIENDADVVMLMNEKEFEAMELIVAKNRQGETGVVSLYWHRRTMRARASTEGFG